MGVKEVVAAVLQRVEVYWVHRYWGGGLEGDGSGGGRGGGSTSKCKGLLGKGRDLSEFK